MRSSLVAFIVLAALAVCAAPAGAAPAWLPPAPISPAGEEGTEPQVAMDATGDAVVAWNHFAAVGGYEIVVLSRAAGGTWSAPARFPTGAVAGNPQVAIGPTGEAVVAFRNSRGAEAPVEVARAAAGGGWTAPTEISEAGRFTAEPTVAAGPGGGVTAIWRQSEGGGKYRVWEATRPPGGDWSRPRAVSTAAEDTFSPRIALDATGGAVAAWEAEEAGTYFVIKSAARTAGGDWGSPVALSPAEGFAFTPELVMNPGGRAVLGWDQEDEGGYYVVDVTTFVPGTGWQLPAVELSNPKVSSAAPKLAIDERGDAVAAWPEGGGKLSVIRGSTMAPGGGWSLPTTITAPGEMGGETDVGLDARGEATVVWNSDMGGTQVGRASRWIAGAAPTPPQTISEAGVDAYYPEVATDAGGDALAVWQGDSPGSRVVDAAGFDGAGPALRSLSIPSTGSVGVPLSFSVAPVDVFSAVGTVNWDFGDGGRGTGAQATHAYSRPGTYTVSVEASDSLGNLSRATGTVTIAAPPAAPVAATPAAKGRAHAARLVRVRRGKAMVSLTCGAAPCQGLLKLTVPAPKRHGRTHRKARPALLLGKASFKIAAGAKRTVAVPLRKRSLARLGRHGRRLPARLQGTGLTARPVVLAFTAKH